MPAVFLLSDSNTIPYSSIRLLESARGLLLLFTDPAAIGEDYVAAAADLQAPSWTFLPLPEPVRTQARWCTRERGKA